MIASFLYHSISQTFFILNFALVFIRDTITIVREDIDKVNRLGLRLVQATTLHVY